jgi:hypothetical protein
MAHQHLRTYAAVERQIEKAHQVRAETARALILAGLTSAMGLVWRILARVTTVSRGRA